MYVFVGRRALFIRWRVGDSVAAGVYVAADDARGAFVDALAGAMHSQSAGVRVGHERVSGGLVLLVGRRLFLAQHVVCQEQLEQVLFIYMKKIKKIIKINSKKPAHIYLRRRR